MGEGLQQYLIDLVSNPTPKKPAERMTLAGLTGLSWVYQSVISLRDLAYRQRWVTSTRLPCLVVSVGNITAGGTGKTPVVQYLARFWHAMGYRICILTRGYQATEKLPEDGVIVSDYQSVRQEVAGAGDEAMLLAKSLPGVAVISGKKRALTGAKAIDTLAPDIIILDDGFQHRQVERDVDIVVIDGTSPFGNGRVLPRGWLREPVSALSRADSIIITRTDQIDQVQLRQLESQLADLAPQAPIFASVHRPKALLKLAETGIDRGNPLPVDSLAGRSVVAACGIGNPAAFAQTLNSVGAEVIRRLDFPDHHSYTRQDIAKMADAAQSCQAAGVVVTEKDAVKFTPEIAAEIARSGVDFWVLTIGLEPVDPGKFSRYLRDIAP